MKGISKILSVTIIAVSLLMPFSILSYAAGYDFSQMGDTDNQSFSGHNDVYTNGIYVGGSGTNIYFDTIMENSNNTYNGTSDIDNTAYPADSYDSRSTYNGTLNVTANDVLDSAGINYVNDATVNANTSVTVNEVLADNTLNAGVQFNDSSFNGDVTLSGSGDVNLAGSTVNNLILGNIPQFSSLIKAVAIIMDNLTVPYVSTSSSTRSFTYDSTSYSYTLTRHLAIGGNNYYFNFAGFLTYYLTNIRFALTQGYNVAATGQEENNYIIGQAAGMPVLIYRIPYYQYTYDATNDVINRTTVQKFNSFVSIIRNEFEITLSTYIAAHIAYVADCWYRWYDPNISAANSQFWIAFNTDTEQYDHVNLSTVFGYITWYLGQLYIQGNEAASDISQSVEDLSDTLTDFETKETQINNTIKSSLDNVDSFFALPTLSAGGVVIGWLQYMWESLGFMQKPTILAWALIILVIVTGFYKVKRITV